MRARQRIVRRFFIIATQKMAVMRLPLLGHDRALIVGLHERGIAHNIGHTDAQPANQKNKPQDNAVRERDRRRIRRNDGGERIDRRAKHADTGTDQNDSDTRHRIIASAQNHRQKDRVERQCFLGHAIGRPSDGEKRHQYRDHPDLAALHRAHCAANAGVDRPGRVYHAQEAAQQENEQRHVDGIRCITVRIVKPRDRGHKHVNRPLRVGLDGLVGFGNGHLTTNILVHHAVILPCRNYPGQDCHQNNQKKQDRIGCWKPGLQARIRAFRLCACVRHDRSFPWPKFC